MQFTLGSAAVAYVSETALTGIDLTGDYDTDHAAINAAVVTALAAEGTEIVTGITGDVTIDMDTDDSVLTTRETAKLGFKTHILGLSDAGVKFTLVYKTGSALAKLFRDAMLQKTEVFFADLSEAESVAGAEGISGNFFVKTFGKKEPTESGAQVADIALIPSSYPHWYEKPVSP